MNVNSLLTLVGLSIEFDATPLPDAPSGVFTVSADFRFESNTRFVDTFFELSILTGGNRLLNADDGGGTAGSKVLGPVELGPGTQTFTVTFEIGLLTLSTFNFFVDFLGTPATSG